MAIEQVREYFNELGIADRILEFSVSSATVDLAAEALGVIPDRICKSLSFHDRSEGAIIVCASGLARVDNRKFKDTFEQKAKMLSADDVFRYTGHPVGGVCPFALPDGRNVRVYMDESLKKYDTIFPACGSANSAIEISPDELFEVGKALDWVDVCKDPENEN
ncbi:MAG: YbaK/EbsC family protein [Clostridiales Family XIII bacterium]|jgi:prolyl-tRNA editing enzyme YbaK/EbsC (Cys-tRNA(Pro) deacylase)|nr:YbaK/EbsC family protein [Clostridiales Family XIII bacterium]